MIKQICQWFQRKKHKPETPKIENPYRRFYSQNRSFEQLVRDARNGGNTKSKDAG